MNKKMQWAENIYNSQIEEMRFAKKQQWRIAYYTILILASTYYMYNELKNYNLLTIIIILVISLTSLHIIWVLHYNIIYCRRIIIAIRKEYPIIKKLAEIKTIDETKEMTFFNNIEIISIIHLGILCSIAIIINKYEPKSNLIEIIIYLLCLSIIIPICSYIKYLDKKAQ